MSEIEQRTPEWFKQRVGKITGSRVGAILGLNPWAKPKDVMRSMVRDYHGAKSEFTGNIATEYGNNFEEIAQGDFEIETGLEVTETGFHIKKGADWLGASPDGLIGDDAVLEIKCPFGARKTGEFKSIADQLHYHAQMQIEMFCAERQKCYFYQWSEKNSQIDVIDYNQHWIDENLPKLEAFYNQYLKEIKFPEIHLLDLVQTKEAKKLVESYNAFKADMEQAKAFMDDAKKQLIALADGKKSNISGVLVYEVERKGSVNYKNIPELKGVDLEQYRGDTSKYWAVR